MTLIPWILLLLAVALQLVTLPVLLRRKDPEAASWKGAIPGLHFLSWLELIQRPWYWIFFLLVPGINLLLLTVMHVELGLAFGRRSMKEQWIMGALPWWGLWELRQGNDNWVGKRDWSKTRKSTAREWSEALIWATVVAGSLRMLIVEPFTIPTPSMEGSMLVGDYLIVSKMSYGPKLPRTPFTMPFVHNALPSKLPLGNVDIPLFPELTPSYTSWFSLPNLRLPGFRDVERYDAVVFSFPHGDTVYVDPKWVGHDYYSLIRDQGIRNAGGDVQKFALNPERYLEEARAKASKNPGLRARPLDKMENYVKRCVGLPGETVSVVEGQLHINGKAIENPEGLQMEYRVTFKSNRDAKEAYEQLELTRLDCTLDDRGRIKWEDLSTWLALTAKEVIAIKKWAYSVEPVSKTNLRGTLRMFPNVWDEEFNQWDPDNFGPVMLPKEGTTVELTPRNLNLYRRWITAYEDHMLEELPNGEIRIDGELATEYTFGMDGYWMMGDNRHRSADSRMWGFVPEDHIVGCATFTWFSKQNEAQHGESKIRWDRVMRPVE